MKKNETKKNTRGDYLLIEFSDMQKQAILKNSEKHLRIAHFKTIFLSDFKFVIRFEI